MDLLNQNFGVGMRIGLETMKRLHVRSSRGISQCLDLGHLDAAYCIDAPALIPSGSCYADCFDDMPDIEPMMVPSQSFIER